VVEVLIWPLEELQHTLRFPIKVTGQYVIDLSYDKR